MGNFYLQHAGRVVEAGKRFNHVMAIALDPRAQYLEGVIRCITSREGDVQVKGYVDRSVLCKVRGSSLEQFEIGDELVIKNHEEVMAKLTGPEWDFIGLEDPDIWIDEKTNLLHLYFTIPLRNKVTGRTITHLGHAVGKDLGSLEMTMPVLLAQTEALRAKEVSIAPLNSKGFRWNLFESHDRREGTSYSTVRRAKTQDMGAVWEFGDTVFHPGEHKFPWIGGHASPGPLLPREFFDAGPGKLIGVMNGREANQKQGDKTIYGMFSVGLFVYDYERGLIEWVSPQPLIQDTEAKTITFASQFVFSGPGEGVLYAHVDDSFVRAYTLSASVIKALLP